MTEHEIKRQILDMIEASMEDTQVPDAIAAYADQRAGKLVTKADASHLEAQLGVPVRIRRQYGMTHVAWTPGRWPLPKSDERFMILAHSETHVYWPSGSELRAKEPAYFAARDMRNQARRELLDAHHQIERIPAINPSHIERAAAAIVKLHQAQEELQGLLDYGKPLSVVSSALEKLMARGTA